MVNGKQQQAGDSLHEDSEAVDQQHGNALLHNCYIRKAVDQFRAVHIIEKRATRSNESFASLTAYPHEQTLLYNFHQPVTQPCNVEAATSAAKSSRERTING